MVSGEMSRWWWISAVVDNKTQPPADTGSFNAKPRLQSDVFSFCSRLWLVNFAQVFLLCWALYKIFTLSDKMLQTIAYMYMEIWTKHQDSFFLCSASLPSFSRVILNKEFSFRRWGPYSQRQTCEGCKDTETKNYVVTQVDKRCSLLLMPTKFRGLLSV